MSNFALSAAVRAVAAVAVAAVVSGCTGGSGGSSSSEANLGYVPSTGPTTIGPTTIGPAPASPADTAKEVTTWVSGYGGPALTRLGADLQKVVADTARLAPGTGPDCSKLAADVTAAQAQPPDPDSGQEQHWFAALHDLQSASQACLAGVDGPNPALLAQAGQYVTMAQAELAALRSEIKPS